MADLPVDKLRAEFKADIKDLKLELSKDLETAVCRIEQAIKAHSEGSSARQSEIVKRFESHESRMQDSFEKITDWKILVESRLAAQTQQNKVSAAVFGSVGAAILTLIVRLVTSSAEGAPPVVPQPPPADYSTTPSRRN